MPDTDEPTTEPTAQTVGEEGHEDPDQYRGEDADPPADTGKPPEEN